MRDECFALNERKRERSFFANASFFQCAVESTAPRCNCEHTHTHSLCKRVCGGKNESPTQLMSNIQRKLTVDHVHGRARWLRNGRHAGIVAGVVDCGPTDFQSIGGGLKDETDERENRAVTNQKTNSLITSSIQCHNRDPTPRTPKTIYCVCVCDHIIGQNTHTHPSHPINIRPHVPGAASPIAGDIYRIYI